MKNETPVGSHGGAPWFPSREGGRTAVRPYTSHFSLPKALLVPLFVGAALALAWQAWVVGVTYDEPFHLVAGYLYWQGRQGLDPTETTPPLIYIAVGWIPHFFGLPVPSDPAEWRTADSWTIGRRALQSLESRRARRLIFFSRLPLVVFPLLTAWLIWVWGRSMFGEPAALWLTAAALLEPNLLAHGPLIKSDVPAAFALVWIAYSCWSFWRRPDLRRVLLLVLSLAVAAVTKFTLLVMIPFAAVVVGVRYALARSPKSAVAALAAVLLAPYLSLIAAYQFQARRDTGQLRAEMHWDQWWDDEDVAVLRVQRWVPLPLYFVRSVRFVSYFNREEGIPGYMLGKRIAGRAPGYFPLALALKYPISLQFLWAVGLVVLAARLWRRQAGADDFFVWTPGSLVAALAFGSHLHIGLRHILPCLPFLLLGGGFALQKLLAQRQGRFLAAALLAWLMAASIYIYPHGLSYFNEWIGGPNQGWKYLADSNIDWGQDLPSLARYVRARAVPKIKLAYFGTDVPPHYFDARQYEEIPAPWCPTCVHEKVLAPQPGVYAVSVNVLLGYFFEPEYRDYFRYFRERKPDAKAGYSIFIYRVEGPR